MSRNRYREGKGKLEEIGRSYAWYADGNPLSSIDYKSLVQYGGYCSDSVHPLWNLGVRNIDVGGDFSTYKYTTSRILSNGPPIYRKLGDNPGRYYEGGLTASLFASGSLGINRLYEMLGRMNSNAAKLVNMARPAKRSINSLNAAYELREIPHALQQRFTPDLMGAANAHLAYQFGWKQLFQDVRKFTISTINVKAALDQLIRDEGKPIRRKAHIPTIPEYEWYHNETTTYAAFDQIFVTQAYVAEPTLIDTATYGEDISFSGRFRYWLPSGPRDWKWKARMIGRILGLDLKPRDVYHAIPWTWLLDWYTNVGDMIDFMDGGVESRMAMDYAYISGRCWTMHKRKSTGRFQGPNESISIHSAETQHLTEAKARIKGTPFGFSIQDNELSLMQQSLLGALGLSKLRP